MDFQRANRDANGDTNLEASKEARTGVVVPAARGQILLPLCFLMFFLFCAGCVRDFPQSNANEVYLLDLLDTTPVRKGTSPADLSSVGLWFRADSISAADGTPLSSWPDSSPNSFHAANGTAAEQPLFRTAFLNGRPVVSFDGVNDFLVSSDVEYQTVTYIAVVQFTKAWNPGWGTFGHRMNILAQNDDFPNASTALYFNWAEVSGAGQATISLRTKIDDGTPMFYVGTGNVQQNEWYILSATFDGQYATLYRNGALQSSTGPYPGNVYNSNTPFYLGRHGASTAGTHRFGGEMAEVLLFTEALSAQDREGVECYLSIKYGLSVIQSCL
ncbi:MAG: LamG domain-containing protein [Leptospiraceae bacterium]|nr:LamG domain-containing protein [Leptospiraceae bacterium]